MGNLENQKDSIHTGDLISLRRTLAATAARLDNLICWTELMQRIVGTIPRERDEYGHEKFGQDSLGKGLLTGIPTEEMDAALADIGPQRRLQTLLQEIDQRIATLTLG